MFAVIGGSGLTRLPELTITHRQIIRTPYGDPSCPMVFGQLGDLDIVFLARHGSSHTIAPHDINYKANLWALKDVGATSVISIAAVTSTHADMAPGSLILPNDIIDYTYGRAHTYHEGMGNHVSHVDFSEPYDKALRRLILATATAAQTTIHTEAVYGCLQGPRLPTKAEVKKYSRDGAQLLGMTGMPEAVLAKELGLPYVHLCGVVGWAAGCHPTPHAQDDAQQQEQAVILKIRQLLQQLTPATGTR
ncbi:MAG: S-methyl-5'-thioinosine phosphorylase [Neisseriaceae bacterium]|nr:S-methyl-5'-thioinosine phosphorylase [Neisseriaceae bacterium]